MLRPEAVTATVLWTMTAWAHEGATHSPILAAISVEPDSGKSTLLGVLRFLVPKPFVSVEPTGPSVYRTVDREHPTLIIDEADDLFYRKSDPRAIVNAGWSRGTRIPRLGRWYDPFCPKILGILGKTKLPRTIASRSIILRMWPKKPEEKAENFAYADDPEFSTIRRKLARWAADNLSIIKELNPAPPAPMLRARGSWQTSPAVPRAGASRRCKLAVARISRPRFNHQKPSRGIAERLRDPSCRRSSDQASRSLAARLQGGAIRGRVCAFLAHPSRTSEHSSVGRLKDVKVFGCSDDCARALRRLTVCQLTRDRAEMAGAFRPRLWLCLRAAAWGQLDPGWNLQLEGEPIFSPCLGAHEAQPNYFVWGCFPKIEWAPAYVDGGSPFLAGYLSTT